jgi:hypothetical protein
MNALKGFFPCNIENCTCWFDTYTGLEAHKRIDHKEKLIVWHGFTKIHVNGQKHRQATVIPSR